MSDVGEKSNSSKIQYTIAPATAADDLHAITDLFKAYTAWLDLDLTFQDFNNELASLPGKYSPPSGSLLIARSSDHVPLGCVALRSIKGLAICEMKRLYVAPEGRRLGLGKRLVEEVLSSAKQIGYQSMVLDTLPRMQSAIALYEKVGFVKIEPYYTTPLEETLFLEIDLTKWSAP